MLGVEDVVDGGEADVLVHAAVAGDVVRVEQLVVVGEVAASAAARCRRWCRRREQDRRLRDNRIGVVRDVDQELVARAHRVGEVDRRQRIAFDQDVVGRVGDAVRALHHDHREAVRAAHEVAVLIGREQRHVVDVGVGQIDAENVAGLLP